MYKLGMFVAVSAFVFGALPALAMVAPSGTQVVGTRPDRVIVTINNSASATINTLIDLELYAQSGTKAHQVFFDNASFGPATNRQFAMDLPTDMPAGTYRLAVGVFNPGWQGIQGWYQDVRQVTVQAPSGQAYSVTQHSGQAAVVISNSGNTNGTVLVDLELYDKNNQKIKQDFWDNEVIPAGSSRTFSMGPLMLNPTGSPYRMAVGIFNPNWQGVVKWFNQVASFTATAGN